jgi:2-polyprenyl-3-methyl-5-hydroxy-6-metoxy-1,4-benzoquinol methylase
MSELPEHVARNRAHWDDLARQYTEAGERAWAQEEPTWGIWQVPEAEIQVFSEELAGKDAIELGCGTAYISAWLSRRGARVVGIDNSEVQLGHGAPPTAAIRARFSAHPRRR